MLLKKGANSSFSQLTVHLLVRKVLSFETVLTSKVEIIMVEIMEKEITVNPVLPSRYVGFIASALFIFHSCSFSFKQMRTSKPQPD